MTDGSRNHPPRAIYPPLLWRCGNGGTRGEQSAGRERLHENAEDPDARQDEHTEARRKPAALRHVLPGRGDAEVMSRALPPQDHSLPHGASRPARSTYLAEHCPHASLHSFVACLVGNTRGRYGRQKQHLAQSTQGSCAWRVKMAAVRRCGLQAPRRAVRVWSRLPQRSGPRAGSRCCAPNCVRRRGAARKCRWICSGRGNILGCNPGPWRHGVVRTVCRISATVLRRRFSRLG